MPRGSSREPNTAKCSPSNGAGVPRLPGAFASELATRPEDGRGRDALRVRLLGGLQPLDVALMSRIDEKLAQRVEMLELAKRVEMLESLLLDTLRILTSMQDETTQHERMYLLLRRASRERTDR